MRVASNIVDKKKAKNSPIDAGKLKDMKMSIKVYSALYCVNMYIYDTLKRSISNYNCKISFHSC